MVCAFFCIFTTPVYAETEVYDYADLLSYEEEKDLKQQARIYDDISVIFLTINDANGKSTNKYAKNFYDSNGFMDNGILFVIDMDNREIYVDTVGGCVKALENRIDLILDEGYSYIVKSDYYMTFLTMLNVASTEFSACLVYENDPSASYAVDWEYVLTPNDTSFIITALITIATLAICIYIHNKENKTIKATEYLKGRGGFVVHSSNVMYLGDRRQVIHGYYNRSSSSSGGRSGGRSGGSRSGGGRSHGGGGRRF
jgi:uncharacterized protein